MTPESARQQTMKAATAAKKLGIYLPATPDAFQNSLVSRTELNELIATPPDWLVQLRGSGPHPRPVVAARLGISISGLTRGGVTAALTTAEIQQLLQSPPAWLTRERATGAAVHAENRRIKVRNAELRKQHER